MSQVRDIAVLAAGIAETAARYRPGLSVAELASIRSDLLTRSTALQLARGAVESFAGLDVADHAVFVEALVWKAEARLGIVETRGAVRRTVDLIDQTIAGAYRERVHLTLSGETLQAIALRYLGDAGLFWRIADANGLDPAAVLASGLRLRIPEGH